MQAATREEAAQRLRREGFQVVKLEEELDEFSLMARRVKKAEIIYMANQLAIMVDTGVSLSEALEGIYQQEPNASLKKVLRSLKNDVEAGECLSNALARHPKHFDQSFIAMIQASEQTGSLGEMLERAAEYLHRELETRNKVRASLAYPGIIMVLASGVTMFLLTFVFPKFTPLFNRQGIDLPFSTVFLMGVSESLRHYWWAWLLGFVTTMIGFFFWRRTEQGRVVLDGLKLHVPLIGPVIRKVTLSRTIRTLATMLEGGVPVLDAIENFCSNFRQSFL